jgi:hypothetical protein
MRAPGRPRLGIVAVLFGAAATALLAGALALGAWAVRRERRDVKETTRVLSFDEAVRLLRESQGRPAPDRRRAADFAGRAGAWRGEGAIAADAARIAWSPPDPDPEDVGALAERLEQRRGAE